MEIPKPFSYGLPLAASFELPRRRAVQVTRIDPGTGTQGAGSEARQHPGQERTAAEARDVAALRREMDRRCLPPGPTPAFKLSLLEMDRDLQRAIARVEARRAGESVSAALRPESLEAGAAREATGTHETELPEAQIDEAQPE